MNVKCPHSLLDSSTHSPLKLWCSLCPSNQQLNSCLQNVLFRHLAWPAAKFLPIVQTPGLTSSWILANWSDTWPDQQLNSCLLFRHLDWPAWPERGPGGSGPHEYWGEHHGRGRLHQGRAPRHRRDLGWKEVSSYLIFIFKFQLEFRWLLEFSGCPDAAYVVLPDFPQVVFSFG